MVTNLEWFAVYGGSSILSKQLALYLALSILLFCAYRISSRSTGVGVAVVVSVSVGVVSSPRSLRIFDIWGSFLALAAEPMIKTNFYSSSFASYCSYYSLAYSSTLFECDPFSLALNFFIRRSSYS